MKSLPSPRLAGAALFALLAPLAAQAEALNPPVKVRYEEVVRSILYVPSTWPCRRATSRTPAWRSP